MKPLSDFNKHTRSKDGVQSQCRECKKRYYAANFEAVIKRSKKWAEENYDRKRETQRLWKIANVERIKEWRRNNKKLLCGYAAKEYSTPKGKTVYRTRSAVYRCLRNCGGKRNNRTFDLLGYTVEELMASLEAKFKPDMSWDNYGKWHIDHIRPIASYNFVSVDDPAFKECWSLANLQPLWAKENISKGARYEH